MAGKTVIAIAHRLSTIARMDRLIVLDHGRIVEQGTHAELLAHGGHYAALWRRQSGGFLDAAGHAGGGVTRRHLPVPPDGPRRDVACPSRSNEMAPSLANKVATRPQSGPDRPTMRRFAVPSVCARGTSRRRSMPKRLFASPFWSDARHYQIAALATLLIYNIGWLDFGARPLNSALAIAAALATQAFCTWWYKLPAFDPRSPLITGLSLSLLLRAEDPWLHALAGVIAIGSKFVFRIDGKHIWNPAGFAIVVLLFASGGVWISPGAWGSTVWFAALLGFFAILVLQRCAPLRHRDLLSRDPCGAAVRPRGLARRSARHSGPSAAERLAVDLHVLHDLRPAHVARLRGSAASSSPPRSRLLAHYMTFFMQMRPALYVALIALSPFVLLIDRILPAQRFSWRPATQGAPQ